MKDDELKAIWKTSNERMEYINLHSVKLNNMNDKIKKFEKTINSRNTVEIIVAIGLIIIYSIFFYIKPTPLAKIGAFLLLLYCFNVIYQLRRTAAKQPSFDITLSLKEQLLAYQVYVLEEQKLYKNIFYWYLLPMLPGLILFLIGTGTRLLPAIVYFGLFIPLVFTFVYYFNRKVIEKRTQPLLNDIARTLANLEERE